MSDSDREQEALKAAMFGGDISGFSEPTDTPPAEDAQSTFSEDAAPEQQILQEQESDFEQITEEPAGEIDYKAELLAIKDQLRNQPQQEAQLSSQQQQQIQTGQQIQQLQQQNPGLYNDMISFAQKRMNGGDTQEDTLSSTLTEFRNTIKGDAYKDADIRPFEQLADLMELQIKQNKTLYNNNIQARQQLQTKVQELDSYRTSTEEIRMRKAEDAQLNDLSNAEKEFGLRIKQGSKAAKQLVSLVEGGENVRDAFILVTGSTGKAKPQKKTAITTSTGEEATQQAESSEQKALRKHIFGNNRQKKGAFIKYH